MEGTPAPSLRSVRKDDVPDPPELTYPRPGSYNVLKGIHYLIMAGLLFWQVVAWQPCIERRACAASGWWPARNLPLMIFLGFHFVWKLFFALFFMFVVDCSDVQAGVDLSDEEDPGGDDAQPVVRVTSTVTMQMREPVNQILGIVIALLLFLASITLSLWLGTTTWQRTYFWVTVTLLVVVLLLKAFVFR